MKPISQLVSLVVAGLSFFVVWLVTSSLAVTPVSFALLGGEQSLGVPTTRIGWLAAGAAVIVAFYGSFPLARCIGRFFPVKLGGTPRIGLIFATAVAAAALLIAVSLTSVGRDDFLTMIPMTTLLLGAAAWTLFLQMRSVRALNAPFILYLRRFSSFSDRALMAALLRAQGRGRRAVFLTPIVESGANFGPMTVAFSGTRLWRPLASCPLPVAARDIEWEDQVEKLARAAGCVVIDVSDRSEAIAREIDIVKRCTTPEKVVWLSEHGAPNADGLQSGPGHIVRYRRSWRAATVRIVFELLAVAVVAVVVGGTLAADPRLAAVTAWLPVVVGVALVAIAAPVILQPSVNRAARRELKDALRGALASPASMARPSYKLRGGRAADACVVLAPEGSERCIRLVRAAERVGLRPVSMLRPTHGGALRESIRQLRDAALVLVDLSGIDRDVEYLLGIAHGLGRKVVLTCDGECAAQRGAPVHRLPTAGADSPALTSAVEAALREPQHQGPVAAVLADDWVFGDDVAGRRIIGFLIDAALSGALAWGFLVWRAVPLGDPVDVGLAAFQAGLLILIGYQFLSLAIAGTTLGMAFVGLRVIDADGRRLLTPGQALGRSLATYAALMPLLGTALAALFGPRYQILEDALSGTRVVRR
jgi:uncharacterized RDD family membrane protein YckC